MADLNGRGVDDGGYGTSVLGQRGSGVKGALDTAAKETRWSIAVVAYAGGVELSLVTARLVVYEGLKLSPSSDNSKYKMGVHAYLRGRQRLR